MGSKVTCRPSRREAGQPVATRISTGQWLPGKKWPHRQGLPQGKSTGASRSSNHSQGRGEDSVGEEEAGGSSKLS